MNRVYIDPMNPSLARIEEKCVDCGICIQTCQKNNGITKDCISCGQCILSCPTGALIVKKSYDQLWKYLDDPKSIVVVSTSPSVRVAIGEEFGFEAGTFLEGKMVAALKKLGFSYVFDTTFGADLTVMEEASELIYRLQHRINLPMLTSCCPSWVLYMEKYHGADLALLSSCKSPIGMQSAMVKHYFSEKYHFDSKKIIHVALTPCVSKKSEIKRPELSDTDYVITTTELACMIREKGIDFSLLKEEKYDSLLGKGSGGGVIFGASGGVMESALRCAYFLLHQKEAPAHFYQLQEVRGSVPMKEAIVDLGGISARILVINELANVEKVYETLKNYDFVEVMTCPAGCIGGAGQPKMVKMLQDSVRQKRMQGLYQNDQDSNLRLANFNPDIQMVYEDYLDFPRSPKSEELLHTKYCAKEKIKF